MFLIKLKGLDMVCINGEIFVRYDKKKRKMVFILPKDTRISKKKIETPEELYTLNEEYKKAKNG